MSVGDDVVIGSVSGVSSGLQTDGSVFSPNSLTKALTQTPRKGSVVALDESHDVEALIQRRGASLPGLSGSDRFFEALQKSSLSSLVPEELSRAHHEKVRLAAQREANRRRAESEKLHNEQAKRELQRFGHHEGLAGLGLSQDTREALALLQAGAELFDREKKPDTIASQLARHTLKTHSQNLSRLRETVTSEDADVSRLSDAVAVLAEEVRDGENRYVLAQQEVQRNASLRFASLGYWQRCEDLLKSKLYRDVFREHESSSEGSQDSTASSNSLVQFFIGLFSTAEEAEEEKTVVEDKARVNEFFDSERGSDDLEAKRQAALKQLKEFKRLQAAFFNVVEQTINGSKHKVVVSPHIYTRFDASSLAEKHANFMLWHQLSNKVLVDVKALTEFSVRRFFINVWRSIVNAVYSVRGKKALPLIPRVSQEDYATVEASMKKEQLQRSADHVSLVESMLLRIEMLQQNLSLVDDAEDYTHGRLNEIDVALDHRRIQIRRGERGREHIDAKTLLSFKAAIDNFLSDNHLVGNPALKARVSNIKARFNQSFLSVDNQDLAKSPFLALFLKKGFSDDLFIASEVVLDQLSFGSAAMQKFLKMKRLYQEADREYSGLSSKRQSSLKLRFENKREKLIQHANAYIVEGVKQLKQRVIEAGGDLSELETEYAEQTEVLAELNGVLLDRAEVSYAKIALEACVEQLMSKKLEDLELLELADKVSSLKKYADVSMDCAHVLSLIELARGKAALSVGQSVQNWIGSVGESAGESFYQLYLKSQLTSTKVNPSSILAAEALSPNEASAQVESLSLSLQSKAKSIRETLLRSDNGDKPYLPHGFLFLLDKGFELDVFIKVSRHIKKNDIQPSDLSTALSADENLETKPELRKLIELMNAAHCNVSGVGFGEVGTEFKSSLKILCDVEHWFRLCRYCASLKDYECSDELVQDYNLLLYSNLKEKSHDFKVVEDYIHKGVYGDFASLFYENQLEMMNHHFHTFVVNSDVRLAYAKFLLRKCMRGDGLAQDSCFDLLSDLLGSDEPLRSSLASVFIQEADDSVLSCSDESTSGYLNHAVFDVCNLFSDSRMWDDFSEIVLNQVLLQKNFSDLLHYLKQLDFPVLNSQGLLLSDVSERVKERLLNIVKSDKFTDTQLVSFVLVNSDQFSEACQLLQQRIIEKAVSDKSLDVFENFHGLVSHFDLSIDCDTESLMALVDECFEVRFTADPVSVDFNIDFLDFVVTYGDVSAVTAVLTKIVNQYCELPVDDRVVSGQGFMQTLFAKLGHMGLDVLSELSYLLFERRVQLSGSSGIIPPSKFNCLYHSHESFVYEDVLSPAQRQQLEGQLEIYSALDEILSPAFDASIGGQIKADHPCLSEAAAYLRGYIASDDRLKALSVDQLTEVCRLVKLGGCSADEEKMLGRYLEGCQVFTALKLVDFKVKDLQSDSAGMHMSSHFKLLETGGLEGDALITFVEHFLQYAVFEVKCLIDAYDENRSDVELRMKNMRDCEFFDVSKYNLDDSRFLGIKHQFELLSAQFEKLQDRVDRHKKSVEERQRIEGIEQSSDKLKSMSHNHFLEYLLSHSDDVKFMLTSAKGSEFSANLINNIRLLLNHVLSHYSDFSESKLNGLFVFIKNLSILDDNVKALASDFKKEFSVILSSNDLRLTQGKLWVSRLKCLSGLLTDADRVEFFKLIREQKDIYLEIEVCKAFGVFDKNSDLKRRFIASVTPSVSSTALHMIDQFEVALFQYFKKIHGAKFFESSNVDELWGFVKLPDRDEASNEALFKPFAGSQNQCAKLKQILALVGVLQVYQEDLKLPALKNNLSLLLTTISSVRQLAKDAQALLDQSGLSSSDYKATLSEVDASTKASRNGVASKLSPYIGCYRDQLTKQVNTGLVAKYEEVCKNTTLKV